MRYLAWLLAIVVVMIVLTLLVSRGLGFTVAAVYSQSMEPTIEYGSPVVVEDVPITEVAVDDIVLFRDRHGQSVLHRVVDIEVNGANRLLTTRGDANPAPDLAAVNSSHLRGRLVAVISWLKPIVYLIRTPVGVGSLLVVPILLFIIHELLRRREARFGSGAHRA